MSDKGKSLSQTTLECYSPLLCPTITLRIRRYLESLTSQRYLEAHSNQNKLPI